ncbi:Serine/threonine-protein kinase ZRK7 [Linum grandiflorum]
MAHISDIKLIRTDTTLDLSQKAEKGMLCKVFGVSIIYPSFLLPSFTTSDVVFLPSQNNNNVTASSIDLGSELLSFLPEYNYIPTLTLLLLTSCITLLIYCFLINFTYLLLVLCSCKHHHPPNTHTN